MLGDYGDDYYVIDDKLLIFTKNVFRLGLLMIKDFRDD